MLGATEDEDRPPIGRREATKGCRARVISRLPFGPFSSQSGSSSGWNLAELLVAVHGADCRPTVANGAGRSSVSYCLWLNFGDEKRRSPTKRIGASLRPETGSGGVAENKQVHEPCTQASVCYSNGFKWRPIGIVYPFQSGQLSSPFERAQLAEERDELTAD